MKTGLLVGYRFQADDSSGKIVIVKFDDYKDFGGRLMATKMSNRVDDRTQTSVSYDPTPKSTFGLPASVKR